MRISIARYFTITHHTDEIQDNCSFRILVLVSILETDIVFLVTSNSLFTIEYFLYLAFRNLPLLPLLPSDLL